MWRSEQQVKPGKLRSTRELHQRESGNRGALTTSAQIWSSHPEQNSPPSSPCPSRSMKSLRVGLLLLTWTAWQLSKGPMIEETLDASAVDCRW